jgi:hypothetical protein
MGGKSSAPPPPDYGPIAAASEKSAELSFQLGKEQLAWAKEEYGLNREVAQRVIDDALATSAENRSQAAKDRARYEANFQSLENDLIRDAKSFSSEERKQIEAGRAQAAVANQMAQQRNAMRQQLESYGVDPTSTRYAALDAGMRTGQAAAQAGAANQARYAADATGRALRSEAINVGRGYPGQIAGQYGTSLNAGAQAGNTGNSTFATGANAMGTPTQWQGLGNQALGVWGNTLNMGYQNQLAAWKAEQDQGGGWGAALGGAFGMMSKFLEDGGPVEGGTPGGAVPVGSSPSQGAMPDDVNAKLTAGEFVVPKDVVAWVGQKGIHQMIEKARKEQVEVPQRSGAIPTTGPAPAEPPAFVSQPQRAIG